MLIEKRSCRRCSGTKFWWIIKITTILVEIGLVKLLKTALLKYLTFPRQWWLKK